MINFHNTLKRGKEKFVPLVKGKAGIYSCGPTVYDRAHIGNLSAFLFVDVLKRWLKFCGYEVFHVMNLTDVDDKTIHGAKKEGVSLREFTEKYTEIFMQELGILNILPAVVYPKATEHIEEMVELVETLLKKSHAYYKDGSVYFRVNSFPAYGQLAQLDMQNIRVGASVDADEYAKDDVRDFVLWKAWKPEEDGDVFWDTPLGRGRPGWHIECSAMSMKYLGPTFDIHTGGVDLIFPHHQNEIAQSEGATGQKFVNVWMHREHLLVNSQKMSKSLGTGLVLKDIAKTPIDIAAFRYFIVSTHYRSPLNFTAEALGAAKNTMARLRAFYSRLESVAVNGTNALATDIYEARSRFVEAMNNDLNTPQAMAAVFELVGKAERLLGVNRLAASSADMIRGFFLEIEQVLGVDISGVLEGARELTQEQQCLIEERNSARARKDWKRADQIRDILKSEGVVLEDTTQGTRKVKV